MRASNHDLISPVIAYIVCIRVLRVSEPTTGLETVFNFHRYGYSSAGTNLELRTFAQEEDLLVLTNISYSQYILFQNL